LEGIYVKWILKDVYRRQWAGKKEAPLIKNAKAFRGP
jgi:hypothetical protein